MNVIIFNISGNLMTGEIFINIYLIKSEFKYVVILLKKFKPMYH